MSGDFYKEWREHSEVNYFPQFILLWLSANSWYRSHYSEIGSKKDRDYLDKLRSDHSPRNKIFRRFEHAWTSPGTKEHAELTRLLESLSFVLNRTELFWDDEECRQRISLENCVLQHSPRTYGSLLTKRGGVKISNVLRLQDESSVIFNGILEILYKVRCQLVHGNLQPSEDNHEIVKHCYFLLYSFMRF